MISGTHGRAEDVTVTNVIEIGDGPIGGRVIIDVSRPFTVRFVMEIIQDYCSYGDSRHFVVIKVCRMYGTVFGVFLSVFGVQVVTLPLIGPTFHRLVTTVARGFSGSVRVLRFNFFGVRDAAFFPWDVGHLSVWRVLPGVSGGVIGFGGRA